MKGTRNLLIGFAAILVMLPGLVLARTERNSFLNRPAHSRSQLLAQVKTDPVVLDRYMRHFGMTKSEVLALFSDLSLTKSKRDSIYTVYNVPDSGVLRMRYLKYRKGTGIWCDALGVPVLKESCGNPLTLGPRKPTAILAANDVIADVEAKEVKSMLVDDVTVAETSPLSLVAHEPDIPEIVAETPDPDLPPVGPPVGPVSSGAAPAGFAPGIPPIPFGIIPGISIIGLIGGGGGHGGSPPPVPEPASILAFGSGLVVVVLKRAKRARSN